MIEKHEIDAITRGLAKGLHGYIQPAVDDLCKRIDEREAAIRSDFEKRLSRLETKGVEYRGVYQRAMDYSRGDLCTFHGSLWHANCETRAQPGINGDWTLAVKRGADAK